METKNNTLMQNMVKEDNQNKPERADSIENKGILEVQGLSAWYGKTLAGQKHQHEY